MDDHELGVRASAGDAAAFEALVRRHADATWRLAMALVSDRATAEDIVQETWLRVHQRLAQFRGEASFRTWVLAICRSRCIDHLRIRRLELAPLDDARHVPVRTGDVVDAVDLHTAVRRLSSDEREAFVLVDVLGYSREDAAAIVGAPPSTMRTRVARARRRIVEHLTERPMVTNGGEL